MHIHKTAGTSLTHQLFSNLDAAEVCPHDFEWQLERTPTEALRRYRVFRGHISPPALSRLGGIKCVTMLREPRARLLSAFFFWKSTSAALPGHPFFERVSRASLLEFLSGEDPVFRNATWNVQARLLAGGRYGATDETRTQIFGPEAAPGEIGAAAIRALDAFAAVGVTEQYWQSLHAMCSAIGLPAPESVERRNEGPQRRDGGYETWLADREIAAALDRLTEQDRAVYDAAWRRMAARPF